MDIKYKCYDKVKGKYVIQNIKTLELELVDEIDYREGKDLGLVQDVNLTSVITRKILVSNGDNDVILFQAKDYKLEYIAHNNNKNQFYLVSIDLYKTTDEVLVYLPSIVDYVRISYEKEDVVSMRDIEEEIYIVWRGNRLQFSGYMSKLNLKYMDSNKIVDFSNMFKNVPSLQELNVSDLDTSNAEDMSCMFSNLHQLEKLDVSNFDTSKVTTMHSMFSGCEALVELDVSSFDTSNVENMSSMFFHCENLRLLNVLNFDTRKVIKMDGMFAQCNSLYKLDLSNFITTNVNDFKGMFNGVIDLEILDISNFDTRNANSLNSIFKYVSFTRFKYNRKLFKVNDVISELVNSDINALVNYLFSNPYVMNRTFMNNGTRETIKDLVEGMLK